MWTEAFKRAGSHLREVSRPGRRTFKVEFLKPGFGLTRQSSQRIIPREGKLR
jgi:hypothetical protein